MEHIPIARPTTTRPPAAGPTAADRSAPRQPGRPAPRQPGRPVPRQPARYQPVPQQPARYQAAPHRPGRSADPLYRRDGVLVTYDLLEVAGRRYHVPGLRNLRTSWSGANPVTWWMIVLSGSVLAAFGVALSFGRDPSGPSPLTYGVLVFAAALPTVVGLCLRRRARRSHELWGDYQGGTHLLYAATDEREFGRVTRALVRACETARMR